MVASATSTAPPSPRAARLAWATATRTGSRSTPAAVSPAARERHQVAADAAAQVDHRRGRPRPGAGRPGGWPRAPGGLLEAVGREVHPAGQVPNFGTARRRSSAWVSAAATRSARRRAPQLGLDRQLVVLRRRSPRRPGRARPGPRRSAATGRRRGPRQAVLAATGADSRAHPGTHPGGVLTSALALSTRECQRLRRRTTPATAYLRAGSNVRDPPQHHGRPTGPPTELRKWRSTSCRSTSSPSRTASS